MIANRKVLLSWIPGRHLGGAEEYAIRIAEEAEARGWVSKLFVPHSTCALQISEKSPKLRIISRSTRYHDENMTVESPKSRLERKRLVAVYLWDIICARPHAIHAILPWHDYTPEFVSACMKSRISTLVTFQLVAPGHPPSKYALKVFNKLAGPRHLMCTISNNNKRLLSQYYGIAEDCIRCIPNRPKDSKYDYLSDWPLTRKREFLRDNGLPVDKQIILTVAGLRYQKGHDLIIACAKDIIAKHSQACFVFIGDGPLRGELENLTRREGLSGYIYFVGQTEDIASFLQSADLFLFPTRYEGESFALLEAARMNIPIIASNASGIAETFTNGTDALLFESENVEDLHKRLDYALSHRNEMLEMAKTARLRMCQMKESEMMDGTFGLLNQITGN